jgi:hypothetical protein
MIAMRVTFMVTQTPHARDSVRGTVQARAGRRGDLQSQGLCAKNIGCDGALVPYSYLSCVGTVFELGSTCPVLWKNKNAEVDATWIELMTLQVVKIRGSILPKDRMAELVI